MIALLVVTDGRDDVLHETMASVRNAVIGPLSRRIIYDDTGDLAHQRMLSDRYPAFETIQHPAGRQGFGGAIRTAWRHLGAGPERFVLHWEDDFILNRSLVVDRMAKALDAYPHLAQLVLKRQPWNPQEEAAGGIIEQHPDDYAEVVDPLGTWVEHRRFWSTNPSLYRRSLTFRGWPEGEHSEGRFSIDLFTDPDVRCAFWGGRGEAPWVHHIGKQRAGVGY